MVKTMAYFILGLVTGIIIALIIAVICSDM